MNMSADQPITEVSWKPSYAIGVDELDQQHRVLLDLLNVLVRAGAQPRKGKAGSDALWRYFADLNEYAAYHFLTEEKLMREHLPTHETTARHIAQHRSYWVAVNDFKNRHAAGDAEVLADLLHFIGRWWLDHVCGIDAHMGRALVDAGVR